MPEARLEVVTRTGTPVAGLADAILKSTKWELNAPGQIEYDLSQDSDFIGAPQENINEVQLYVDDVLLHQAIHYKTVEKPQTITFTCPGLAQYFQHMFITNTSLTYTSVEQMQIAAAVIQAMQTANSYQDKNIGIYNYTPSGVIRSRDYKREEHKNVMDILSEFPTLAAANGTHTGFDWDIDIISNPGQRLWRPYYPYRGTTHVDVMFEWGKNIVDFTVNKDGSRLANRVYMTGGTDGTVKFEQNYADDTSRGTYGEWQDVVADASEKDVGVLLERAQSEVNKRKNGVITADIVGIEIPDKLLGVIWPGDWVWIDIDRGRTQFHAYQRIQSIEWLPGPGNLKIGFAQS